MGLWAGISLAWVRVFVVVDFLHSSTCIHSRITLCRVPLHEGRFYPALRWVGPLIFSYDEPNRAGQRLDILLNSPWEFVVGYLSSRGVIFLYYMSLFSETLPSLLTFDDGAVSLLPWVRVGTEDSSKYKYIFHSLFHSDLLGRSLSNATHRICLELPRHSPSRTLFSRWCWTCLRVLTSSYEKIMLLVDFIFDCSKDK